MISNSTTSYKLKNSKQNQTSKESTTNDAINSPSADDEIVENSTDQQQQQNVVTVYNRENHQHNSSNNNQQQHIRYRGGGGGGRSAEFRPSRINNEQMNNIRRGNNYYRGRSGTASHQSNNRNRGENSSDNFYILSGSNSRKYNHHSDSTAANASTGGGGGSSSYNKYYENEKKNNDIKLNLPEDTRISKLLRRLSIETDQDNSLAISKKLLEVLLLPDNAVYVRKAFHILGESMYEILQVSPGPLAKQQSARALGRMGYIMGQENDFERYQNWLFLKMANSFDDIQILFMKSLKETLAFERNHQILGDHIVDTLLQNLVSCIEITENPQVFKAILDVLINVIELYPDCFYSQFRDTVDLLFGWHVDHTQPISTIEFISRNLQKIAQHFKYHIEFAVSLVENFIEDIINFSSTTSSATSAATGRQLLNDSIEHVTVLILALNTVLKCLGSSFKPSINNKYVKIEFITNCLEEIIKTVMDSCTTNSTIATTANDNLIIAANESIELLLGHLDNKSQNLSQLIFNLIDLELSLINNFTVSNTTVSLLLLIAKIVKELSPNLPIELIEKLIGPNSEILKLRNSQLRNVQNAVICVYQALLNLKNVSLLQEAYRYVLCDLENAYIQIVSNTTISPFIQNNPFRNNHKEEEKENESNAELTVLFLLRCLSQLANASSIIVMWALKPSILELFGLHLEPYNEELSKNYPALQYALLYFLYSHCKCYNHFISSSKLIVVTTKKQFALSELNTNDVPNTSPNLENFEIILNTLEKTLNKKMTTTTTTNELTLLMLQWLNDILTNSDSYLESLYDNEKFLTVIEALVKCGYHFDVDIVKAVSINLEKLFENKQIVWNRKFLMEVCDLCKLHINSNNDEISKRFTKFYCGNIPWDIVLIEFNKPNTLMFFNKKKKQHNNMKNYNNYMIAMAQHFHLNSTNISNMYPLQFKKFMDYLLMMKKQQQQQGEGDNWLEEIFTSCFNSHSNFIPMMDFFFDLALNSRLVLNYWASLDSAQFCVNYKLRTPLGKPNETFTKIESALNQLGNGLIITSNSNENNNDNLLINCEQVGLLLQFIEHLEKCIYVASEGCAFGMPQHIKPVRSFFIANTNTCNEWICRIRMVVIHVALHAADPNTALRHCQALLLTASTTDLLLPEFERIVMFTTRALLQLREIEALIGLYVYCKNFGKKFPWIKCAIDQAAKRYELAIEGYRKILKDDKIHIIKEVQEFINDQIIICFKELADFDELIDFFTNNDSNCIDDELTSWKKTTTTWSTFDFLTSTESNLYSLAFNLRKEKDDSEKNKEILFNHLNKNLKNIEENIRYHINLAPSGFLQNILLLQYVGHDIKNILEENSFTTTTTNNAIFLLSENYENEFNKIDSSILRKILWWTEYFCSFQNENISTSASLSLLRLNVINRSRKEKNYKFALKHLRQFFNDYSTVDLSLLNEQNNVAQTFLTKLKDITNWSKVETAKATIEIIKIAYCLDSNKQDCFNLCAAASTEISKNAEFYGNDDLRKISSKILLKLANWLQLNEGAGGDSSITEISSPLGKLLMVLPEIGNHNQNNSIIPLNEMAIGKLLQFSVHQCNSLAKSWNAFGTWCYCWGRRIVGSNSIHLTDDDLIAIKNLLPIEDDDDQYQEILMILSQTNKSINNIDDEDTNNKIIVESSNTSEMIIRTQLKFVNCLKNVSEDVLENLIEIWRNCQKRIYTYYTLSAEAYFKYLNLSTCEITNSDECNTITVTLRLLRLIVKYALELQCILEEGLKTTPTQPWKVIIPQLFSRLNHPENYVRHRVSDLLCRIAEDAPHLITFPAVVGALEQGGLKFDFSEISLPKDCLSQNNDDQEEDEEEEEAEENNIITINNSSSNNSNCNELNVDDDDDEEKQQYVNSLQSCFKTMVDTLSKQDPETISQVQTLVKELRRITLLWDELWLGTLAQHQSEFTKRQQQLEYEIRKVNENPSLNQEEKLSMIAEKHRIIIKPIVFVLEQLQQVTIGVEPETPHEKHFQEKYSTDIKILIEKLKNPECPEKPNESLQPLKALQKQFQQKFHKRASYTLRMQDISPILATIKNTLIAMPGLTTTNKTTIVTISHVSNIVSILPTKTKPKKLIFYGTDGQTYTYLFKGLEDLHLDERIMQFLNIANTMMAHNNDNNDADLYRARHYSVIPLGPRSGLISWVDGTTPVFALYKRWQQREITKTKTNTANTITTNNSILRPSELFYNKLNPLLKELGIKNIENRKEWPLSVLKQVLEELMAETPSDLLAKELWCISTSASAWWQVVKRYSYSVAVMSIIGYIIGLGDRHLDNVLIDLTSGELVHIDYNVCFEKGKNLRVPEKVPFRLTQNIREALGVTGIEGIFRTACENVLKTMRKGRETLLTLLEAFVYDPLIDWTIGGGGGEQLLVLAAGAAAGAPGKQSKKELEKEIALSMFNVRCREMRDEWNENRENISSIMPYLNDNLKLWLDIYCRIRENEDNLQDLHQQIALVKEAEAHGINNKHHSLYNLPMRYETYCKSQEAMKAARKDLDKIIIDSEQHIFMYNQALQSSLLISNDMMMMTTMVDMDLNIFDLVKEFLHNAGKTDIITQCEQSENEIETIFKLENVSIKRSIQLLQDYNTILSQCPKSFNENHRIYLFLNWAKYLIEQKTIESCDLIYDKFYLFSTTTTTSTTIKSEHILQFVYNLETFYKETITQINKLYEDLTRITNNSGGLLEQQQIYNNAKIGIETFLNCEKEDNDNGAGAAFKFVIANELVLLNKNLISLETTANRSGDLLMKLTTKDGDWFLDDLVLNSSRAVEMINNLLPLIDGDGGSKSTAAFLKILNGIKIGNNIYKGLNELHYNFHTIILPETMKKIQNDEESVFEMIENLRELINTDSIEEIIFQFEKILRCLYMKMDINPSCLKLILERVGKIRSKFEALLIQGEGEREREGEKLSSGKMLLMGFNGLFVKLDNEMNKLISTLENVDIDITSSIIYWKKLDQIKEAKSIAADIFNPQIRAILDDIFLLKRLQTIIDFFNLAKESITRMIAFNDEQLVKPVRQYIADFISRKLLGIIPESIAYGICFILKDQLNFNINMEIEQKDIGAESKVALDELCQQKAWTFLLKQGTFTQNILSQASSLETNLKNAWEKIQEPKKIESKLELLQSSAFRIQNQLSVYNFMYEDCLTTTFRSKFLNELKNEMINLNNLHTKLIDVINTKQKGLIENLYQRLNWAKGANPNIKEICAAFENAINKRDKEFHKITELINTVLNNGKIILQHELLRTTTTIESKTFDKLFLNSFEKWRIACQYANTKIDLLTPVEESIMMLFNRNILKNPKWLNDITDLITIRITKHQTILNEEKTNLFAVYDKILLCIEQKLKPFYNVHSKLMADVKNLLKTMSKFDCFIETQKYLIVYRQYIENFTQLFAIFKKETTFIDIEFAIKCSNYIQENTKSIYNDLFNLEKNTKQDITTTNNSQTIIIKQQQQQGGQQQQRNVYAMNVWRRVKMKLEGRDTDAGRKFTPQEQVDYIIREAMNLENLALLYEGWTPWV